MTENKEKERPFKLSAKEITDMLFDKRLFIDSLTRDDMNKFEELIELILTSRYESYIRCQEFLTKLKKQK